MPLPGLAPVAMQQGRYAARDDPRRLDGGRRRPFHYVDKGNLATIGRSKAVADIKGIRLAGFPAWVTWLVVHLFFLIGFQNRLLVAAALDDQLPDARARRAADRRGGLTRGQAVRGERGQRLELACDADDVADDEQRRRLEALGELRRPRAARR